MSGTRSSGDSVRVAEVEESAIQRSGLAALASGLFAVVVGIVMLAWPSATLRVVAFLFAIQLIVFGVIRLWVAQGLPPSPKWLRPLTIVLAVLTIVAGLICLFSTATSIATVGLILAIGWLLEGFASIAHAFTADGVSGPRRVGLALAGVVLVIGGIIVAAFPQTSIALLIRWSAILLLVIGIAAIIGALFQRRRDSHAAAAA